MTNDVVVIGGGAAGVMAACTAAEQGHRVLLIEKNERIGRKVMITGKGRCNVTNATYTVEELLENIPVNPRFLYSAFHCFMPVDTMELFEGLGVPLKIERGNRVFPVSDKAVDIVDAMDRWLKQTGVHRLHDTVKHILADDGVVTGVETEQHGTIDAFAVILATGGCSYPRTGSTGDGYRMAEEVGHTVTGIVPSLVPMTSDDRSCADMQGLSLRNVSVSVVEVKTGKTVYSDFGEMLFTHFGVSGPVILSASSHLHGMQNGEYELRIDLKPALSDEQLEARLLRDFEANSNKDFRNALGDLLPKSMIPVFLRKTGV
ncbi:MAG: aminoacetone oxidase family FAD-binding enzyme, partial [Clostridia bacterium]|nr:aminoacetone oxidase family FAD-binding enzyme [Clostridia bacterium]